MLLMGTAQSQGHVTLFMALHLTSNQNSGLAGCVDHAPRVRSPGWCSVLDAAKTRLDSEIALDAAPLRCAKRDASFSAMMMRGVRDA
jgi:hypothetical protein